MEKKTETKVGLGFSEALTILFIALRLCCVIDWPWLWVLSPIWITLSLIAILAIIIVAIDTFTRR